ncbi:hypothetical protein JCM3766R1_002210 [Sporobolomyces carnicolor]
MRPTAPSTSTRRLASVSCIIIVSLGLLALMRNRPQRPSTAGEHIARRFSHLSRHDPLPYQDSLDLELGRCPTTHAQSNQDQLRGDGETFWKTVETEELARANQRIIERVTATLEERGMDSLSGNGQRGLVFTAGNGDTLSRLLVSLRILRHEHRCELPVEIFGFKDELEASDPRSERVRREIDEMGQITWRPVIEIERARGAWKQFHIKGEAIASSRFSEILYLDSDNIAVTDPTYLFDSPLYKRHGVVFWPDFNRDSAANPIWRLLDVPCDPVKSWQIESGQLLIDKRARDGLNAVAVQIAKEMNRNHEFWYRLSGGDKDTFRYAFYFLDLPFTLAPHFPSSVGTVLPRQQAYDDGHVFCGHTMLQFGLSSSDWQLDGYQKLHSSNVSKTEGVVARAPDKSGHAPPLFVHANLLKYSGSWNQRGSTFETIKRPREDEIAKSELDQIRQSGFSVRGICSDVWSVDRELEGSGGQVELFEFATSFEGVLSGFEEMYWEAGGRAGGY